MLGAESGQQQGLCFYSLVCLLSTPNPEPGMLVGGSVDWQRGRENEADRLDLSRAVASRKGPGSPTPKGQRWGLPSREGLPRPAPGHGQPAGWRPLSASHSTGGSCLGYGVPGTGWTCPSWTGQLDPEGQHCALTF